MDRAFVRAGLICLLVAAGCGGDDDGPAGTAGTA